MSTFPFFVVFLTIASIQATPFDTRDDLQDLELVEIKKMMKLQSQLIQSQAELLNKHGQRIELLEKGNHALTQEVQSLRSAKDLTESIMKYPNNSKVIDDYGSDTVTTRPGQALKDYSQLRSVQDKADGNLSRTQRVPDIDNSIAVGFYSQLVSPHPLLLGQHQTIEFEHVITNIGNGYDSSDGHFTAPIAGLYSFTCTALPDSSASNSMHLSIVKNGVAVGIAFSQTVHDTGTRTVVLYLAVGDMVWVRNANNNSPNIFAKGYTTFSGHLIAPYSQ